MILPQRDKEPDLAFAGLAILILFGFLILHDNPIKSSRPADTTSSELLDLNVNHAYKSWLWEDPFGKTFKLNKERVTTSLYDQKCESLGKKINDKSVEIFAALLDIGLNPAENKETRIRHRYAKIAGLIEAGYSPSEEPHQLHYCRFGAENDPDKKYNVGWEHFTFTQNVEKGKEKPNDVILLWLDDSVFNGKTLLSQKNETSEDAATNHKDDPDNAHEFLMSLTHENKNSTHAKKNLYLFDWSYSDYCWNGSGGNKESNESDEKATNTTSDSYPEKIIRPLKFLPQHSKDLVEKLAEELIKYRRIKDSSEIAIIVEQDTQYIRKLSDKLQANLKKESIKGDINRFSYYKGLDAYQHRLEKEENRKPKKWNEDGYLSSVDLRNPPLGAAQYDYLHRMATQIKNSHKSINFEKRIGGIRAVVIFGSDFDDKLLILQALRSEMPNILILTTDLDARMLHPQYFRWTRNLVVASSFGLRLPPSIKKNSSDAGDNQQTLQTSFPAFRDSQQAEIFYNTKRLLAGNNLSNTSFSPVLFEIGRNGHVFLPPSSDHNENLEKILPEEMFNQEQNYQQLKLLVGITIALIALLYGFRPNSIKLCFYIGLVAIVIFYFHYQAIEKNEEPLSFTNGISLWPAIFIQIIAIALAGYFFYDAYFGSESILQRNFKYLQIKFFEKDNINNGEQAQNALWKKVGLVFFIIVSMFFYALNDLEPDGDVNFYFCVIFLGLCIVAYFAVEHLCFKPYFIAVTHWTHDDECYSKVNNGYLSELITNLGTGYDLLSESITKSEMVRKLRNELIKNLRKDQNLLAKLIKKLKTDQKLLPELLKRLETNRNLNIKHIAELEKDQKLLPKLIDTLDEHHKSLPDHIAKLVTDHQLDVEFITKLNADHELLSKHIKKLEADHKLCPKLTLEKGLWIEYSSLSQLQPCLIRITMMWLVFALIETILFYLVPSWPQPVRGDFALSSAFYIDWFIGIASFIVIMFLSFFVLDTYRLNYYFIRKLRIQHPLIVDDVYLTRIKESDVYPTQKDLAEIKYAHTSYKKNESHKKLEEIVNLVAERTQVVDGLIYYPLICIILMLFARISYFDNQDFPYSKAVSFGACISLLIFAGFMIRSEAEKLKFAVIKSAESLKKEFKHQVADIDATIEKIGNIRSGVFQPMLEQPVMRTLLLILGFVGILAGEFLMIFG
ncbi:hypothetical protein [Nitrosomonas sp.]|uniref:hypothetical protein n=1 Tax=Nitrosomonas sp. TaxID=42353 RepID=UPI0025F840D3|nr:hypothetical protein [Nitrosomonas sp.]